MREGVAAALQRLRGYAREIEVGGCVCGGDGPFPMYVGASAGGRLRAIESEHVGRGRKLRALKTSRRGNTQTPRSPLTGSASACRALS
jgi:hypothetical protein